MKAACRGANMGFRSVVVSPKGSTEVDYSDLLLAQRGVANKFKPAISTDRLLALRSIASNKKIFEDSFLYTKFL